MRKKLLSKKSHQEWSWVIIVSFFLLSIVNIYFGLLGLICMTMPLYHAFQGRGKIHCSHYCPRGSFLGKFLDRISFNKALPNFMRRRWFKNLLLILMVGVFSFALFHTGGNLKKISFVVARLMFSSFMVGIIIGIFSKPRAWCQICPMGHGTSLVKELKDKKEKNDKSKFKEVKNSA